MCGICGFIELSPVARKYGGSVYVIKNMLKKLDHRGPDDSGVWADNTLGIVLGHSRLSVVDLSVHGKQPMESKNHRYILSFNGEIYNYAVLKKELQMNSYIHWDGHSDTEVLLEAIAQWGVEKTLTKLNGMFAFALWDRSERVLCLARDRIGEKPLYYGWQGDTFLFASQINALRVHPGFEGNINRDILPAYLRFSYIPTPYSIYENIKKLSSGSFVKFDLKNTNKDIFPEPVQYWSLESVVKDGLENQFIGSDEEAVSGLEKCLEKSITAQMIADVPVGAFLSGGIDSSLVVALMQKVSSTPVHTFTIGFDEAGYNEANYAKMVAQQLGTDHTELYVSHDKALSVIPGLPTLYDEPFADSSQIPMFIVSEMARQYVTVCLSGDGGDELFAGYNRYFMSNKIWGKNQLLPIWLRKAISGMIMSVHPSVLDRMINILGNFAPDELRYGRAGDKLHKAASILPLNTQDDVYQSLISHWDVSDNIVLNAHNLNISKNKPPHQFDEFVHYMMYFDTLNYLPDDILVKVDRAAMGVSLETRLPLLDHDVIKYAWALPLNFKIRNGEGKWLVKKLLSKFISKELINRPKMGFGVPIDSWLRGPLRGWAEDLLDPLRLEREGFFNPEPVRKKWDEHLSEKKNWQYHLWSILVFQQWYESQVE